MASSRWAGSYVTQKEFQAFHTMDRRLYAILVVDLLRDPVQSMQILGLWLWLESVGYRNVVQNILCFPSMLIPELADEAVICLHCISTHCRSVLNSFQSTEILILHSVVDKEICLKFFWENRTIASEGVKRMMRQVTVRACKDIMEYGFRKNAGQILLEMSAVTQPRSSKSNSLFPQGRTSHSGVGASQSDHCHSFPNDRTMFITFSRGYPVDEWELRDLFTTAFGKSCIESVSMQEVNHNQQSLYAVVVFRRESTVELILSGASKADFVINGKQVRARNYITSKPAN